MLQLVMANRLGFLKTLGDLREFPLCIHERVHHIRVEMRPSSFSNNLDGLLVRIRLFISPPRPQRIVDIR